MEEEAKKDKIIRIRQSFRSKIVSWMRIFYAPKLMCYFNSSSKWVLQRIGI